MSRHAPSPRPACRIAMALCRAEAVSEDRPLAMRHVLPAPGEYPATITMPDGKRERGRLVIDEAAYQAILTAFAEDVPGPEAPGLLVDREHLSLQPAGDSRALAWVKSLECRPDGLWAGFKHTPAGLHADGDEYKYRSPVTDLQPLGHGRYRPIRLRAVALTNVPQIPTLTPSAAARAAAEEQAQETHAMTLAETLRELLAMPDADDAALAQALTERLEKAKADSAALSEAQQKLQAAEQKLQAAESEKQKLQDAAQNAEVDAIISENRERITDEAAFRAACRANPESARALLGAVRLADSPQGHKPRTIARRDGRAPSDRQADVVAALEQDAARRRAEKAIASERACSMRDAIAICRRENPALYTLST